MTSVPRFFAATGFVALGWLAVVPWSFAQAAMEWALIPSLESAGGYDDNRFSDSTRQGSAYLLTRPSMESIWFLPLNIELSGVAACRSYDYTQ